MGLVVRAHHRRHGERRDEKTYIWLFLSISLPLKV